MHFLSTFAFSFVASTLIHGIAAAAHRRSHFHRVRDTTTLCGKNEISETAAHILYNNLWGQDSASGGSQCTYLDYTSGSTISWHSEWSWEGGTGEVKSYPNAVLNVGAKQLSSINGLPTTFNWSYTGDNLVADVSYDAFLSPEDSTTATHEYEIMIWLASFGGAEPIGYGDGPVASPEIGGITWDLYKGPNSWTVFSFVARSTVNNYSGDLNYFFQYLIKEQGVSSSQYLQTIGAGTEPFTGTGATFNVSPYRITLE